MLSLIIKNMVPQIDFQVPHVKIWDAVNRLPSFRPTLGLSDAFVNINYLALENVHEHFSASYRRVNCNEFVIYGRFRSLR